MIKNIFLLGAVSFSAVFILSGCVNNAPEEATQVNIQETKTQEELPVEAELEKVEKVEDEIMTEEVSTKRYEDEKLKITFDYPAEWGELEYGDNEQYCVLTRGISIKGKSSFFSAANNIKPCEFGVNGWQSRNLFFADQEFVDALCENERWEKQSCKIKTNASGVTYAKTIGNIITYVKEFGEEVAPVYYIFNPNSDYSSIVLSTGKTFVDGALVESDVTEEQLDVLVESLEFIE